MSELHLQPGDSISAAVAQLPDGGDIYLAPGTYSKPTVTARPLAPVYIHAANAVVGGAALKGTRNVTILGGRWTAKIIVDSTSGLTNPVENVTIDGIDTRSGVEIMNAALNIQILNSHIHDGGRGIHGPGRVSAAYASENIVIKGNTIERMSIDGIAFGDWNDVTIVENTIRDLDGSETFHNDAIQLYGGSQGVLIARNDIKRSGGQGILVQASTRPIHDVTLSHNVVQATYAVAVVFDRVTGVKATYNQIDGGPSSDGGLWLTNAQADVVAYNTISSGQSHMSYRKHSGGSAAVEVGNVVS